MTKRKRGRKPIEEVPSTECVKIRVTPAQRLSLRRIASDNGTGLSGVVREAINEYVGDYDENVPFKRNK